MLRCCVSPTIPHVVSPDTYGAICYECSRAQPFLLRCSNRNQRYPWDILTQAKGRILDFVFSSHTPRGIKLAAIKFMQKVILVQTRGVSDPRVSEF